MMTTIQNLSDLLRALLKVTTPADLRSLLEAIGDYADAGLDEAFGPFDMAWHAFGGNPSNFSTIGLGSKAGRSLTERLTNGQDALLEDRVQPGLALPASPRDAAKQWFGRPISGPDDGLFNWNFSEHHVDRRLAVVIQNSGLASAPTIDALDNGIGIHPRDFPTTILSLQQGNKITKRHLIGAFGQGGSATLGFCEYALVVSRHRDTPLELGFTVVRILSLSDQYKEDCYGYLCVHAPDGAVTVPSCAIGPEPVSICDAHGDRLPTLAKGTLIRHYGYNLPNLEKTLSPASGNLYSFLHCSMFDPLFPFRVIDLRDPDRPKDELVTGSRNRLMKLVQKKDDNEEGERTEIRHYRPMEYVVPHGATSPSIGIEYWVVHNYRKVGKPSELQLRSSSNQLFVQSGYPIVGTLNGQNQGELSAQVLRDLGLGMVSRHVVVHIDASKVPSRVRRELFSTTREGFKEGDALNDLTSALRKMLEEDEVLFAIERELTERLAKRDVKETKEEVKRHVTRLLLEAGLRPRHEGITDTSGGDETQQIARRPRRRPYKPAPPLPTLPFPQVTKFSIVVPNNRMEIRLNDAEHVLVETDADSEFDRRGLIAIRSEPSLLELASAAPLRGGRARWRLRPTAASKQGDSGRVIVTITRPDGTQISDSVEYQVLPPPEDKSAKGHGFVPDFDGPYPINPDDDPSDWATAWPHLADEDDRGLLSAVAYRQVKAGGRIIVYYSTIFTAFAEQSERLKTETPALAELFQTTYEIWIACHAILQEMRQGTPDLGLKEESLNLILEEERCRVARLQVKQAMQLAQLRYHALRERGSTGPG